MTYALVFAGTFLLPMPDLRTCETVLDATIVAYQQKAYLGLVIACPDVTLFKCLRRV